MLMPRNCLFPCLATLFVTLWVSPLRANSASYYILQPSAPLSGSPSSLLLQSSFLDVPAGAVLAVHLMKGHQVVSTSRLEFSTAYRSAFGLPVSIVSFLAPGSPSTPGEPVAGARLSSGITDLTPVVANPSQYQFFWSLSAGVIGPPGQALITDATIPLSRVDFKLSAVAAALRQSDQKPGSVLFYHRYLSTIGNPNGNNTTISLTNTSPTDSTKVRLFFIAGVDCKPLEQAVCLAPQQTTTFLMSDYDPGITGYCVAVACDALGQPTQFNWLIGNAQLRQTSLLNGQFYDSTLSAIAVAKRAGGVVTAVNNVSEMAFDDTMYDRLPAQLAADNLPSQGTTASNGNATLLSLYRPVANLAGGATSTSVSFTLNNSTGQSTAVTQPIGCYNDLRLSTMRFNPALATILSVGKTGWLRISAADNGPLFGAQFNSGQYASGASMRAITYAADYRIRIPLKAPGC
jgi:hypothetical protein